MSIKYSTIADVVKRAYVYNSIDLHHIPEDFKTTLHCILQYKSNQYNELKEREKKESTYLRSIIDDSTREIADLIPEIDKALHTDELLYSIYPLTDDAQVIYVYVPEDINLENSISIMIQLMGIYTAIHIIPKNLMDYPKRMYRVLYYMISSMINIYNGGVRKAIIGTTAGDMIKAYSCAIILLSLMDLHNNEKMKKTIFEFLAKRILPPTIDTYSALDKIEALYKETLCYSVEELLDRGYILAII